MKLTKTALLYVAIIVSGMLLTRCNYNPQETKDTIKRGKSTIAADESLKPLVDAQVQAYVAHYPETSFTVKYVPEQQAVNLMITDSVEIAIITRELRPKEKEYYEKTKIRYEPATMALDAVALIVNKNSSLSNLTIGELKKIFLATKSPIKLVFDNSNSSNLSHLRNKLGIENTEEANIFAANGNNDVFDYISRNKDAIGVVGNNWISDKNDKKSDSLKQNIRVLAVAENKSSGYFEPSTKNLKARKYPLERLVYLHTTQSDWRVAKGFIRFACSQVGQLVVEKMGLIPYYIIPKVYVMDNTPVNELQKTKEKK